jgi:hypothetical protein
MPTHHTDEQADDLASLYKRCLEEIRQRLEHTTTLTADTFQAIASAVHESLEKAGQVRQEDLQQIIDTMVTQWRQVLEHGTQVSQDFSTKEAVQSLTEQSVSLLAHLAGTVKAFAGELENRLQPEPEYQTGTVVGSGNFFCVRCDKAIQKVKTGPLPPCSRCHGTVFRQRR